MRITSASSFWQSSQVGLQKFKKTGRPLYCDNVTGCPLRSGSEKSGAISPAWAPGKMKVEDGLGVITVRVPVGVGLTAGLPLQPERTETKTKKAIDFNNIFIRLFWKYWDLGHSL
jgi:hypothetical protein